jgi:hypothetical protein
MGNNIINNNPMIGNLYTPQKHMPSNNIFTYNKFLGNNLMANFNYQGQTQQQVINRGSMISSGTDYSSNNKRRQGGVVNDEGSEYFDDHNSVSEE